ncbi:MAG: sigma-70 family RNA polymerase sigma factor [Planctomycetota bacterium]|nr:sigma-70 family RNA polymerase sigma factor [Planctomycetota bacterium]MDA1177882.1 sigma-70 family RNA polymerase sigma factor [Planctomycetota bacterium]
MVLTNNDRDLLARCLAREPLSWNQFVDRFLGLVLHIVRHTAQGHGVLLDDADSDDLTADVFLTLVDRDFGVLRRFRGRSSLATYLTVVARRVVVHRLFHDPSHLMSSQARSMRPGSLRPVLVHELGDHELGDAAGKLDPAQQRIGDREQVERLMSKLDPPEAAVVRMFHLEGRSYQEISARIGMPENTIGPTLSRARNKMRISHEDSRVS